MRIVEGLKSPRDTHLNQLAFIIAHKSVGQLCWSAQAGLTVAGLAGGSVVRGDCSEAG